MQIDSVFSMFECSSDACIGVSDSCLIISWNKASSDLFGYSEEEVLGRSLEVLTSSAHLVKLEESTQAAVLRREAMSIVLPCFNKNGSMKYVSLSITPLSSHDGALRVAFLMGRDVTSHWQTLKSLRDVEFKLHAIVNSSPSALSLKTPQGAYVLANPNLQAIHNLTEKEIIGKSDFDLYPLDVATNFRQNDQIVIQSGKRYSIEEWVPVHGEMCSYMSHIFPIFNEAGVTRFVCRISLANSGKKQL